MPANKPLLEINAKTAAKHIKLAKNNAAGIMKLGFKKHANTEKDIRHNISVALKAISSLDECKNKLVNKVKFELIKDPIMEMAQKIANMYEKMADTVLEFAESNENVALVKEAIQFYQLAIDRMPARANHELKLSILHAYSEIHKFKKVALEDKIQAAIALTHSVEKEKLLAEVTDKNHLYDIHIVLFNAYGLLSDIDIHNKHKAAEHAKYLVENYDQVVKEYKQFKSNPKKDPYIKGKSINIDYINEYKNDLNRAKAFLKTYSKEVSSETSSKQRKTEQKKKEATILVDTTSQGNVNNNNNFTSREHGNDMDIVSTPSERKPYLGKDGGLWKKDLRKLTAREEAEIIAEMDAVHENVGRKYKPNNKPSDMADRIAMVPALINGELPPLSKKDDTKDEAERIDDSLFFDYKEPRGPHLALINTALYMPAQKCMLDLAEVLPKTFRSVGKSVESTSQTILLRNKLVKQKDSMPLSDPKQEESRKQRLTKAIAKAQAQVNLGKVKTRDSADLARQVKNQFDQAMVVYIENDSSKALHYLLQALKASKQLVKKEADNESAKDNAILIATYVIHIIQIEFASKRKQIADTRKASLEAQYEKGQDNIPDESMLRKDPEGVKLLAKLKAHNELVRENKRFKTVINYRLDKASESVDPVASLMDDEYKKGDKESELLKQELRRNSTEDEIVETVRIKSIQEREKTLKSAIVASKKSAEELHRQQCLSWLIDEFDDKNLDNIERNFRELMQVETNTDYQKTAYYASHNRALLFSSTSVAPSKQPEKALVIKSTNVETNLFDELTVSNEDPIGEKLHNKAKRKYDRQQLLVEANQFMEAHAIKKLKS